MASITETTTNIDGSEKFAAEIAAYRRELPRLLDEGHAGRYALFHGDTLLSVWDTQRDAIQARVEKFGIEGGCIIPIDARHPAWLAAMDAQEDSACPR